jgi:nucleoporin NUP159
VDIADAIPNTLAFAFDDTRLVVGLTQGSIAVFDTGSVFTPGTNDVFPLHTFAPTSSPTAPRLLAANPANIPLIAILRERDPNTNTHLVEVLNVETMQLAAEWRSSNTPDTTPSASTFLQTYFSPRIPSDSKRSLVVSQGQAARNRSPEW